MQYDHSPMGVCPCFDDLPKGTSTKEALTARSITANRLAGGVRAGHRAMGTRSSG